MFDLTELTDRKAQEIAAAMRRFGLGADSLEAVAQRIVRYLYDHCVSATGQRQIGLVRVFKSHPYRLLPDELRTYVDGLPTSLGLAATEKDAMRCLALLATAGAEPAWNDRRLSARYRAVPLINERGLERLRMVSQLIDQFGLSADAVLRPDPSLFTDSRRKNFNVFFVPTALGSPYIPAQADFVIPYGIQTVLGIGAMMPDGDFVTVILFLQVILTRAIAESFKYLMVAVQLAMIPLHRRVFGEAS
jgi:hypothetical protein